MLPSVLPGDQATLPRASDERQASLSSAWRQGWWPQGGAQWCLSEGRYTAEAKGERRQMRAVIQAASGKAEEESIVELLATTTTQTVVVWAPIRAAEDPRDTP